MALTNDLISQFAKITNDKPEKKTETIVYGTTAMDEDGNLCVKLDGSEITTPVISTTNNGVGERVMVMIKNHTATITGNISSPSAQNKHVQENSNQISKALGLDKLPEIPAGEDLNNYITTGCYAVYTTANAETITNIPTKQAGRLEVLSSTGEGILSGQWAYLRHRFVPYNRNNAVWEREVVKNPDDVWSYGDWWRSTLSPDASNNVYHRQKVLWGDEVTSGMYMSETHVITLAEAVSAQPNGIVLVFCAYNGTEDTDYAWQTFFVPKQLVSLHETAHSFVLSIGAFTYVGIKYLYINDTTITGHTDNDATGTSSGITYANNKFVLRYVIGV